VLIERVADGLARGRIPAYTEVAIPVAGNGPATGDILPVVITGHEGGASRAALTKRPARQHDDDLTYIAITPEKRSKPPRRRRKKGLAVAADLRAETLLLHHPGRRRACHQEEAGREALEELEDILIQADLGVDTAMAITTRLEDERFGKEVSEEEIKQVLADEVAKVLEPVAEPLASRRRASRM
jgi:signal recognition particle GTPase